MTSLCAVVDIRLEKSTYTVLESAGESDLGLSICATVEDANFDFIALLLPQDGTAVGMYRTRVGCACVEYVLAIAMYLSLYLAETVDYRVGTGIMDFFGLPGTQRVCVCIQIIEDDVLEDNETFFVTLSFGGRFARTTNGFASVTILDDDGEWHIADSVRSSSSICAFYFLVGFYQYSLVESSCMHTIP